MARSRGLLKGTLEPTAPTITTAITFYLEKEGIRETTIRARLGREGAEAVMRWRQLLFHMLQKSTAPSDHSRIKIRRFRTW